MENGQGDRVADNPDEPDEDYYCCAELLRLAELRGDSWVCGCGHKFGTKEGCAKGLTDLHVKDHENSMKHR